LQLNYAKKALDYALEAGNKNWIAYSYFNLSRAYQAVGNVDSLSIYAKELITRLDDIYPQDLPAFKACIGYMYYKKGEWELAKKYYEESLEHQETAHTLVNLADVYVKEGNEEEAYKLWKRAFLLNDGNVKDVKVSRSIHTALDEEAVRVISASPKWRPGRHRGKKVKVALTIPVDFRLEKNSKGSLGINGKRIK
jgi:tetratricopeptide (TPR) repeat protein